MKKALFISLLIIMGPFFCGCDQITGLFGKKEVVTETLPPPDPNAGKRNGPFKMYYDDGTLKAERNFKNDTLHGVYKEYYDNGTLKVEGFYKDDKMEGVVKRYNRDGSLKAEETYQDNLLINRKAY